MTQTESLRTALLLLFSVLALDCGHKDDGAELTLDSDTKELSAEEERLRRLQSIKANWVRGDDSVEVVTWNTEVSTMSGPPPGTYGNLWAVLNYECAQEVGDAGDAGCAEQQRHVALDICFGDRLLLLATLGEPLEMHDAQGNTFVVPPQSVTTNAALAEAAAVAYHYAARGAAELLLNATDGTYILRTVYPFSRVVSPVEDGVVLRECRIPWLAQDSAYESGVSLGAWAAANLVGSYERGREAYNLSVQQTLAAADAQSGTTDAPNIAAARVTAGTALSRAAAAHLLVGGEPGIDGLTTEGLCSVPRLSAPAKRAISYLRLAGQDPAVILDPAVATDELVTGSVAGGNVEERVGQLNGHALTNDPVGGILGPTGLAMEDFAEARVYLRQELIAFGRNLSQKLPEVAGLPVRYAAVASSPFPRPNAHWEARVNPNVESLRDSYSLASLTHLAVTSSQQIRNLTWAPQHDDVTNTLKAVPPGRLVGMVHITDVAHTETPGGTVVMRRYSVSGVAAGDGFALVGDEAIGCALDGEVEGVECQSVAAVQLSHGATPAPGFTQAASASLGHLASERRLLHLVKLREGHQEGEPGAYESVAGFVAEAGEYAIVPEAQSRMEELLAPDREWCATPETSCAGSAFDLRMPLENELSDDGDNVESSWRHYLALARQAAAESDQFANEYLSAGLETDLREEDLSLRRRAQEERAASELGVVQSVCGTAVDPSALLSVLGTSADGTPDFSGADLDDAIVGSDEFAQVKDCLASARNETAEFFHLGDRKLCIWSRSGEICGGPTAAETCPLVAAQDGTCPPLPQDAELVEVIDPGLGWFSTAETVPPAPTVRLGDTIRYLRANPEAETHPEGAKVSQLPTDRFSSVELPALAAKVELESRFGGYVALLIAGEEKGSTGSTAGGPASGTWPCRAEAEAEDPTTPAGALDRPYSCTNGGDGFFCLQAACDTIEARAAVNLRIANAVAMAKAITWRDGAETPVLHLPGYLYRHADVHGRVDSVAQVYAGADGDGYRTVGFLKGTNDKGWTSYTYPGTADPSDSVFLNVHNLGVSPLGGWVFGIGDNPYYTFVLRDVKGLFVGLPPSHAEFWGGLAPTLSADEGLIYRLLAGSEPIDASPQDARSVFFSEGYAPGAQRDDNRLDDMHDAGLSGSTKYDIGQDDVVWQSGSLRVEYTDMAVLDAFELLAEVVESTEGGAWCNPENAPDFSSVQDFSEVASYLECMANRIEHGAATAVFRDFPSAALNGLKQGGGLYETEPGEMGEAISNLRGALLRMTDAAPRLSSSVKGLGYEMRTFNEQMRIYDIHEEMSMLRFWSTVSSSVNQCIQGVAGAMSLEKQLLSAGMANTSGTSACADALAQTLIAQQMSSLEGEETQAERNILIDEFNQRVQTHVQSMVDEEKEIRSALEDLRKQLGIVKSLQKKAQRGMQSALWHLSFQATNQAEISAALARRQETARVRYVRAHERAQRMAFLAKRAVEQRLGVHLSDMTEDLPLVEAPIAWESTVCQTSPINYEDIRDPNSKVPNNYADQFIGEYVKKLENVVESYRLEHDFHEGSDEAVISLRDDLLNVRAPCEVPSRNLLGLASRLDLAASVPGSDGWIVEGCAVKSVTDVDGEDVIEYQPNCISSEAVGGSAQGVSRVLVTFGDGGGGCNEPGTCGLLPESQLVQRLVLPAGKYVFSWYGTSVLSMSSASLQGQTVVGSPCQGAPDFGAGISGVDYNYPPSGSGRFVVQFTVEEEQEVSVGFKDPCTAWGGHEIIVWAPMLEQLGSVREAEEFTAGVFADTTSGGMMLAPVCEDSSGEHFRQRWEHKCEKICRDGYASDCREQALTECYWEASFDISQRSIEAGWILGQSGFARGNFNYRIEDVGINVVGTGVRECENAGLPSTCYGGGFVPYTILHDGPFFVRNHEGDDFRAELFRGRIEHARALANERYLSNPLGSADRELMSSYLRGELAGRPLDGSFTIRIWDDPAIAFERIEDVQILLKYRYWTRFD